MLDLQCFEALEQKHSRFTTIGYISTALHVRQCRPDNENKSPNKNLKLNHFLLFQRKKPDPGIGAQIVVPGNNDSYMTRKGSAHGSRQNEVLSPPYPTKEFSTLIISSDPYCKVQYMIDQIKTGELRC